jgi:hypothetical protein
MALRRRGWSRRWIGGTQALPKVHSLRELYAKQTGRRPSLAGLSCRDTVSIEE